MSSSNLVLNTAEQKDHAGPVISLVARPVTLERIARSESQPSLGDQTIFTNDVYRDEEKVGFDGGVCTIVRIDDELGPIINCNVTLSLPEGTITAQVMKDDVIPPPPFHSAITGGTGAYQGARGQIYIDPNSPEVHFYTVYLEPEQAAVQ